MPVPAPGPISTFLQTDLPSQVKLQINKNAFCIVQRATAQSKTGIFRDCGVAEALPGFQAGWSDCMDFFFSLSVHFVCSSGVTAAQKFVSLRRLNHENFEREIKLTYAFYSLGSIPSQLYRHEKSCF
jgi:hypothetical protein